MLHTTHHILITNNNIVSAALEALKEVPKEAHDLLVIANSSHPFPGIKDTIKIGRQSYPFRIDPVFDLTPPDTVYIGYGVGNLE